MDTKFWDDRRGIVRSKKGGWRIGKDVTIHGHSLLNDLMGSASWFQLWLLSVTGRMPERRLADWCESVWFCLSYPDPRIWCNQVSALAGSMRCTPGAAVSAATMTSDALLYAGWAARLSGKFLEDALKRRKKSALSIEALLADAPKNAEGCPQISGFSRPITLGDERMEILGRLVQQYGFTVGEHLALAFEIDDYLNKHYRERMNSGAFVPAFLLDQGLSLEEIYRFYSMSVQAGAIACYIDTHDREAESFLPMRCDDFDYQGVPSRSYVSPA